MLAEAVVHSPSQSALLSYGISLPNEDNKSPAIAVSAARNAELITRALCSHGIIPQENARIYDSQYNSDQCTFSGMHQTFKEQLAKVGEDGLFVFIYVGPTIKIDGESPSYSLRPTDFDASRPATHLTAARLSEWLSEVPNKPKHVLFILDCPLAAQFGNKIKSGDYKLHVISSQNEPKNTFVDTLGYSIFSYFWSLSFQTIPFQPNLIPLRQIFAMTSDSTAALSSLIVTYDVKLRELKQNTTTPEGRSIEERVRTQLTGDSDCETDLGEVDRFRFLTLHFHHNKKRTAKHIKLHDKATAWLDTTFFGDAPMGSFDQETKKVIFQKQEVLLTAICSVVFSLASIQAAEVKNIISDPDFFIYVFMCAVAYVNSIHCDADIPAMDTFKKSWSCYRQVVLQNGLSDKELVELFQKVDGGSQNIAH